jgi:malate dehydrogenase (oxaloacetate-decarboxylating)(NADP+)
VCGARRIGDELFVAAADALASCVGDDGLSAGALYPPLHDLRRVTACVAAAVVRAAARCGAATHPPAEGAISAAVAAAMWTPRYPRLVC